MLHGVCKCQGGTCYCFGEHVIEEEGQSCVRCPSSVHNFTWHVGNTGQAGMGEGALFNMKVRGYHLPLTLGKGPIEARFPACIMPWSNLVTSPLLHGMGQTLFL